MTYFLFLLIFDFTDNVTYFSFRAVVGAPEAETAQAGVYRGGAVYKCDIAADDRCNIIHFDDKGNEVIDAILILTDDALMTLQLIMIPGGLILGVD